MALAGLGFVILLWGYTDLVIRWLVSGDRAAGYLAGFLLVVFIGLLFLPISTSQMDIPEDSMQWLRENPPERPGAFPGAPTTWQHVQVFFSEIASLSPQDWERISDRYLLLNHSLIGFIRRTWPQRRARSEMRKAAREVDRREFLRAGHAILWGYVVDGTIPSTLRATEAATHAYEALLYADLISERAFGALYAPFEPYIAARSARRD